MKIAKTKGLTKEQLIEMYDFKLLKITDMDEKYIKEKKARL